ncbi:hypothetical protein PC123_g20300 [Phytophthora cactorum]|nr:hypothetical protein PC120_g20646 [Phytophthora cactorum]KAG4044252.1 hypothetical protein PC123_g20300 [Phytophthora cactorum]
MQKAGSIREVSPRKNSIGFLIGSTSLPTASDAGHVVSNRLERVYDPQDRRTKASLPVTRAKGRMETAYMPDSGWQVSVEAKMCGCRIFSKMGYCVHLLYALSVRDKWDLFGRKRLICRGRNRAQRAPRCGSSCK